MACPPILADVTLAVGYDGFTPFACPAYRTCAGVRIILVDTLASVVTWLTDTLVIVLLSTYTLRHNT